VQSPSQVSWIAIKIPKICTLWQNFDVAGVRSDTISFENCSFLIAFCGGFWQSLAPIAPTAQVALIQNTIQSDHKKAFPSQREVELFCYQRLSVHSPVAFCLKWSGPPILPKAGCSSNEMVLE
jgi:hypothetical protein